MKYYTMCFLVFALLATNVESCQREFTPEEIERFEREWRQEHERDNIKPPIDNWRQYIK